MTASERRNLRNGLLFISPWVIGFAVFMLYPIVSSLYFSFCDYSVLESPVWIGAENYTELVKDEVFWTSLGNTGYYAGVSLPLGMMLALAVAILLNTQVRGMTVYRTIFFLPSIVPIVAMAILWLWIFNGQYGVLNYALGAIGIPTRMLPTWLDSPGWAMPALIIMGLWGIGYSVVIYLAGLQDIPVSLYESADIDGASWWQKIVHITIPMLSPVIYFNLVMGIIGTFQIFAAPYIMTNGGPERATTFYTLYLYNLAFGELRMGYACAMAWILFVVILLLTLIATKVSQRHVHYER
ncbi:sugar ABC transporter permease [bacterium]|nr:sugar ABC transporter permease [Candidatus Brocadiia bacterium]NQT53425.1 sugar ABC transporter permease [bacterium]